MATIKRREGKNGASYLIRSSCGYDVTGKQIMRSMTWRPKPGMTEKQIEKELNRQAVLFDEKCSAQGIGGGNVKFETFSKQWFKEYAEPNLRPRTIDRLHQQEPRVYEAIGHIRLDRLTARHIQGFVHSLGEDGLNKNTGGKLSPKTIRNYIAFVSSILSYAVKMGIIQDNPCRRVTLPHVDRKEKEVYTLEEAQHFLESLEAAPIRYQTFCVLAIYSGLRRGELLGLEWPDIDFNNHTLNVRRSSLYTKEKNIKTSRKCIPDPSSISCCTGSRKALTWRSVGGWRAIVYYHRGPPSASECSLSVVREILCRDRTTLSRNPLFQAFKCVFDDWKWNRCAYRFGNART